MGLLHRCLLCVCGTVRSLIIPLQAFLVLGAYLAEFCVYSCLYRSRIASSRWINASIPLALTHLCRIICE